MIVRLPYGLLWLAGPLFPASVYGFDFSVSPPAQCDPLNVSWSGGRPPFQLLVIPPDGTIRNISIPVSDFDNGSGNGFYTLQQLGLPQGSQLVLSMSDANGIFSGGTSALMIVGASQTQQACNTTDPGTEFYFSLDSPLAQCSPYPFTQYEGAFLPITILVHVPQGQSFVIHPPPADSFTWTANLTAGTQVAFSVYDSDYRIGGTSSIRVVQSTDNTSCLTSAVPPAASPSSTSIPTEHSQGGLSVNVVKGLAIAVSIGALGLLGFIGLIGFCCYRKNKLRQAQSRPASSFVDLTHDPNGTLLSLQGPALRQGGNGPTPLTVPHRAMQADAVATEGDERGESYNSSVAPSIGHRSLYQPQPFLAQTPQRTSQPRTSKWSIQNQDTPTTPTEPTNITYPSNIIVHTDISESLDGPIELPPRYSGDRPPLPGFPVYIPRSSVS